MTDTLSIRDNRTGRDYELAITDGTIRAADLKQITAGEEDPGIATYDPGFVNTASCRSAITYIDGDKGILEYRGYPIDQLAEHSTFLEVSYLLLHGELPTQPQLDQWVHDVTYHTFLHENCKQFIEGFRYDAHPMGMLMASVSALSTFYPDAGTIADPDVRQAADHPADREDADPGRVRLPAPAGQAVRLPRQPAVLLRQLPGHAVQDERADLPGRPAAGEGARGAVHPARRPRAELLDQRGPLGRLLPGRSLLGGRRRGRRPLRPAARRRQRGGAEDAAADRHRRQHPGLHRRGEGGQGEADGLRPPGLQELRPARHHHQEGLRRRVRGDRGQPAARASPRSWRRSRSRTSTSSSASSTPTSTSTPA